MVDLPGVRDANAARGAVAEKYMKSCNAVWIVADITRAVDNRTAKVLLTLAVHLACIVILSIVFDICQHLLDCAAVASMDSAR